MVHWSADHPDSAIRQRITTVQEQFPADHLLLAIQQHITTAQAELQAEQPSGN